MTSLPVGVTRVITGLQVRLIYAIIVVVTVLDVVYPRESVALKTKLVVDTLENVRTSSVGATSLMYLVLMVAEFFAVAVIVHCAVDLYRISVEESPVKATVVAFVSTTVPLTVGELEEDDAVAVNVHVVALPSTVVLLALLYVLQVMVQVPVFAFGI